MIKRHQRYYAGGLAKLGVGGVICRVCYEYAHAKAERKEGLPQGIDQHRRCDFTEIGLKKVFQPHACIRQSKCDTA